ncbi:MAG: thioredoxin family protein [Crocinitomicaceae bacterium]|jgi:thioredoxin 1|nr:thioredoxin family protein [Crocinitomicaceae bacterium]
MKRIVGILSLGFMLVILMTSVSSKPSGGIDFQKIDLTEAKAQAIKTGKYVFIDCYTDWCGPCKRMAATSFMEDRVADVYNKQFINIKIEMEKDKDGPETALMYKIKAYPTLLIIDGKGNLVKQAIGMQSADGLIALAKSVEK